jgi:hypothetical protein
MDQDNTTTSTPRSSARRNERDARTLDSPERRRIPGPLLPPPPLPQPFIFPAPAPIAGPSQSVDPFQNNYVQPPRYQHLPTNLMQAYAQLPPLQPRRGRGRGGSRPNAPQHPEWMPVHVANPAPPVHVPIPIPIPAPPIPAPPVPVPVPEMVN